jgi:hypothetical protein
MRRKCGTDTHSVGKSKPQKRKDQSFGSMAIDLGSIREVSRQSSHQRPSRAQQDLRNRPAPPPSHCSSSRHLIRWAPLPQPGEEWVSLFPPNERRDQGFVESRSLNSSRLPSPTPSVIRQASTTDTLVKRPIRPTKLVPDHHGLLASERDNNPKRNLWLGMASESFDSCSETSSGSCLRLKG